MLVACSTSLLAQKSFKYKAVIDKTDSSGFYRINLPPAILAKSRADFADIRLFDNNKRFIPYIFGSRLPVKTQLSFTAFPQVKAVSKTDTVTSFIAENKDGLAIDQLYIRLRNTSVYRTVNLAGSDDLKNWYAIKENILLNKAGQGNYTNGIYEQLLNFPTSTYRYFKIAVNNNRTEPVAILQAGIYQTLTSKPVYTQLPSLNFTQNDTGKVSHVLIKFGDAYRINKIRLNITGAKYYKRNITIYDIDSKNNVLLADTNISSVTDTANVLNLSAKSNTIELIIANEDNPPLKVAGIAAFQLEQSLIAYLDKGSSYQLLFGDSVAIAPVYDLGFFADSLQRNLAVLSVSGVSHNAGYQNQPVTNKPFVNAWLIWIAIIVVGAVLAFLTFKMTQELSARKKESEK
ncbi:hypothetical protein [Mucilaginibacter phyllosphaerae]